MANTTRHIQRWQGLKTERSSWDGHWKELAEFFAPHAGRFTTSERNDGKKKFGSIYDNSPSRAHRILSAGMMAGMTSPARPWFRLTLADVELSEQDAVQEWLSKVTDDMRGVFSRSNVYRGLHTMYGELGLFGTSVGLFAEHPTRLLHLHTLTAGEYAISMDMLSSGTGVYREFDLTVEQIVRAFGLANVSDSVRSLWNTGAYDKWRTVVHAVTPRESRDPTKLDAKNKPFESCYFELGAKEGQYLRVSGFDDFPALTPRWATTSNDTYGYSPAMEALGDAKQLQHQQYRKAYAIDMMTDPPLVVPSTMRNQAVNRHPGGVIHADLASKDSIRTAFDVNLNLDHLLADINDVRDRINGSFYADLFLMMLSDNRSNITAREVVERHEEKMLMLGPVLERLQNEMLEPLIGLTFARMARAGLLPPPPPELQGQDINVEFVSALAQAQRAVGVNAIDRLLVTVGAVGQLRPEALDKLDQDKVLEKYADMLGADPTILLPAGDVAYIRQQRAQQQQQQQAMEAAKLAQPVSAAVKTAAETDAGKAAETIGNMFSGYTG